MYESVRIGAQQGSVSVRDSSEGKDCLCDLWLVNRKWVLFVISRRLLNLVRSQSYNTKSIVF